MQTRTLIAFFLAICGLISCAKSDPDPPPLPDPPRSTFTISGVHDVLIDTSGLGILALTVADVSGDSQQSVSIWMEGIPRGIGTTSRTSLSGTTDFNTSIGFTYDGVYDTVAAGTYPIKLTGASASDTVSYNFNLTIPPFNGFRLNLAFMRTASMSHTANTVTIRSQIYGGTLVGDNPVPWPTADGTYTYMVGAAKGSSLNFTYIPKTYATIWTHGRGGADTAIVTISGGRMSIKSGILHTNPGQPPFQMTIDARE